MVGAGFLVMCIDFGIFWGEYGASLMDTLGTLHLVQEPQGRDVDNLGGEVAGIKLTTWCNIPQSPRVM